MKIVKYTCNLCREEKPLVDIACLYWKSDTIPQRYAMSKDISLSDMHICNSCIKEVNAYYQLTIHKQGTESIKATKQ